MNIFVQHLQVTWISAPDIAVLHSFRTGESSPAIKSHRARWQDRKHSNLLRGCGKIAEPEVSRGSGGHYWFKRRWRATVLPGVSVIIYSTNAGEMLTARAMNFLAETADVYLFSTADLPGRNMAELRVGAPANKGWTSEMVVWIKEAAWDDYRL